MKVSSILATLGLLSTAAANFMDTCMECGIGGGPGTPDPYLVCMCRRNNGNYERSQINLSRCITNANGRLVAQANGGFGGSCFGTSIANSWTLRSKCNTIGGGRVDTSIDLYWVPIDNFNGDLRCYGLN
ncbi:uncharacterized protein CTRU02_210051 [Colletotrichum truncatum]|uniref:Uncharacterized protein n=1 Tax=Colletotrichum truncatum TaxID=5467 RepID=A0ACC3YU89_COLTU|nr:uncharacterized protein CTRU02_02625 [Colletotrichum truncatum]KAF6798651.1 hypothetical protein CTRU02_02625 [Colletotrichum truncatum]